MTAIQQTSSDVTVTLRDGEKLQAGAVVVATPLNTWRSIDFDPALTEAKRELIAQGHAGHGEGHDQGAWTPRPERRAPRVVSAHLGAARVPRQDETIFLARARTAAPGTWG